MAGATALRFSHIGLESFWLDEGASVGIARLPWSDFFKVLWHREGNMALYYLFLRGWMLFGQSDGWVRGLSAVFSITTVPFVYLLGKEIRSTKVAAIAAVLFAVSPFAIAYAQEARGYSLVALLLTIAAWTLVRAVRARDQKWWAVWTVAMGASVYVHLFVVFVMVGHFIYLWLAKLSTAEIRRRVGAVVLISMPMVAFVTIRKAGQLHWVPKLTAKGVQEALSQFAGGGDLAWLMLFLVVIAAMVTWGRGETREVWLVWLWLLLPVVTLVVVSIFRPLLVARFLILEIPALMLVAALALDGVPRWVGALLLMAAVFFGIRSEVMTWWHPVKDDFRSATAYVLEHGSPQDGVIFDQALGRHAFEHYANGRIPMKVISPAHGERATYRDFEYDPPEGLAWTLESAPKTVWVVMNSNEENGKLDRYSEFLLYQLRRRNRTCNSAEFRGVEVLRCS